MNRRGRLPLMAATALVGALTLGGCAGGSGYSEETAGALQARVLAVTESAAASDYPTTVTRLAELRAAADDALARGDISEERYSSILSAADLVQGDVDAAIEAARVAAEQAAADQAAADQAAADQAAADEEDEDEKDEDEKDKGKPDRP